MALLEVKNLGISFGGLRAVNAFDIKIEKGQLYGLIGPNGAGKTTIFNLLTGGMLLGSVFMATDYVTSPMSAKGGIIFGVGIGLITMLIRYFGSYPEGMSFAILIMNATVPLINKFCKSKKFGR